MTGPARGAALAYYNEWDSYAADWLQNLIAAGEIAPGVVDRRSIRDVRPVDLAGYERVHLFAGIGGWDLALRLAAWPDGVPVWTGSCPCQPFSAAGRRGGFDDDRHLWPEMFRLVAECRPAVVLGEQVASRDGLAWLDLVSADLEGADYAFGAVDCCAAGVGAPHIRQRLWWVGVLADSLGPGLERRDARPLGHEREAAERGGEAGGVGDARGTRGGRDAGAVPSPQGEGAGERRRAGGEPDQPVDAGAVHPWSDLEWLPCQDGKARPTQPGLLPLVDGLSFKLGSGSAIQGKSRVGMLRGAGNAIVPQVAAAFIRSVMAALHRASPAEASGSGDEGVGT